MKSGCFLPTATLFFNLFCLLNFFCSRSPPSGVSRFNSGVICLPRSSSFSVLFNYKKTHVATAMLTFYNFTKHEK